MDIRVIQVRIRQDVFDALKDLSAKEDRWLGQQVAVFVREGLERLGYQMNPPASTAVDPPATDHQAVIE